MPLGPVIALPGGRARVGIEHPHLIDGLSADQERFVAALEHASAGPTPRDRERYADVLRRLDGARSPWQEAATTLAGSAVRVVGVSALAVEVAVAVAGSGVGAVGIGPAVAGAATARSAAAAAARVCDAGGRALLAPHLPADITVYVAGGTAPLDLIRSATARDDRHLAVVTTDAAVRVCPVVIPGETPCMLCLELAHCDADPDWPAVAMQAGARGAALLAASPAFARSLAAGEAARRVVAALRGESEPPTTAVVPFTGAVSHEPADWHRDCGCRG